MALTHDLRDQITKVDEQIVDLLAERKVLCEAAVEEEDEMGGGDIDTLAEWEERADERGWNLTAMGKICRGIMELCKKETD